MKYLFSIVFVLVLSSCTSQTNDTNMIVKYEAITRGSFIEITYTSDEIVFKNTSSSKKIKLTSKLKRDLKGFLEKINYTKLHELEPPSTKSYSDAALQATLSVTLNDKMYKTQAFDHGNPPKKIQDLIEKLLNIVEQ